MADGMEAAVRRALLLGQDQDQKVERDLPLPGITTGPLTIIPALCARTEPARLEESIRCSAIKSEELVSQKMLEQSHVQSLNF